MTPKEFIINRLSKIRDAITGISFTYIYEKNIDYHTILVEPVDIYMNNESYKTLEMEFVSDFCKNFPELDIVVSETVPYIKAENVIIKLGSQNLRWDNSDSLSYNNALHQMLWNYDYALAA